MEKDWTGNYHSVCGCLGARNECKTEREEHDYYATEPKATELLMGLEKFDHNIWECACGEGHISKVLEKHGYAVKSTDLIDRGFGEGGVRFLKANRYMVRGYNYKSPVQICTTVCRTRARDFTCRP